MVEDIKQRHPHCELVFVTARPYRKMVLLSETVSFVYGASSWTFAPFPVFGLIEKIYSPQTTDERDPLAGAKCHLVDDLAGSCGLNVSNKQSRLFAPRSLIEASLSTYGLLSEFSHGRRLLAISCGRTWPVRMWDAYKWQQLVDLIHKDFDVTILQFGFTLGPDVEDEFDKISGVVPLVNRLKTEELIGLLASCSLVVSIDSGPVHIAGALGVPLVGLFGAVNPQYRMPKSSPAAGVISNVPCLFCHNTTPLGHWKNGCPHNMRCMKELDVQSVFTAVRDMLSVTASKVS